MLGFKMQSSVYSQFRCSHVQLIATDRGRHAEVDQHLDANGGISAMRQGAPTSRWGLSDFLLLILLSVGMA